MKERDNSEIDLLLRNLGKQAATGSVSFPANEVAGEHLDPDALVAFAEDALPASARAHYSEHLADCEQCRKIITQLVVAAGATIKQPKSPEVSQSGFWAALGRFFSPTFLRFAVPTLAVLVVVGFALMFFRQERRTDMVAQKETVQNPPSAGLVSDQRQESSQTPQATANESRKNEADSDKTKKERQAKADSENGKTKTAEGTSNDEKVADVVVAQPTVAAEPPAPAPKPTTAVAKKAEGEVNAQPQVASATAGSEESKTRRDKDSEAKAAGAAANTPTAARGVSGLANLKPGARNEVATRLIAGRRFRYDENKWVDTEYSGQATTNVARGSEQYRALVSDEPEVGSIAEALKGEVILLWKGRAYRIR